ncbi:MAG: methyltransferase domain-containing protein [Betaproteobacteria bacterium]|nr:MAG: methyltransferase domain-containing protein [Betaproteobacteria bacterium]
MTNSIAESRNAPACIVCGSSSLVDVGDIAAADLVRGYRKRFGLDVSGHFSGTAKLSEMHCRACDLRFFSPIITGNESFYRALASLAWYYMAEKPEFAIARRFVKTADSVLEVGAGRGAFAAYCGRQYVGLEFNPEAVAQARCFDANVIVEPLEKHALAHPASYDVCCAFQVLEHVADPKQFVASMAAATRPGGRVIVSVPNEAGLPGGTINDFLNLPPHHVTRWNDRSLGALATAAGLSLEAFESEKVAVYHHGWYLAVELCKLLAPHLMARPGNRVRLGFTDYALWRALWLLGRSGALILRPLLERTDRLRGRGHTVLAVMRKGEPTTPA